MIHDSRFTIYDCLDLFVVEAHDLIMLLLGQANNRLSIRD